MRMVSIASGSTGNCIYIGNENTHILVDTGITKKRIEEGLNSIDLSLKDIDAILVTHEHIDHIKGLGVILRKHDIPVYATRGTLEGIKNCSSLGQFDYSYMKEIEADSSFEIGDFKVNPFKISHDAAQPVAYTVSEGSKKAGIITDLGKYDEYIINNLIGVNALLCESNHDINMLQVGSYPYPLKQRILGDYGHLSNEACGRMLGKLLNDDISGVMLGHISLENNYDKLALQTVKNEIDLNDTAYKASDFDIKVASHTEVTMIKEF